MAPQHRRTSLLRDCKHHIYRAAAALLIPVLLAACSKEPPSESAPAQADTTAGLSAFRQFLDANYAEDMVLLPATASRRGIHINDREWNPVSEAFKNMRRAQLQQRLAVVGGFDPAQLDDSERLSWRLIRSSLRRRLASDDFRRQKYPLSQRTGPHIGVPSYMINLHNVADASDAENYIARLRSGSDYLDETIEQLHLAARSGTFLPDWAYPQVLETIANTISGAPFDEGPGSALWADFNGKLAALELADEQRDALREDARRALVDTLRPAYLRLAREIERQAALAPAHDGVWKLENGEAFYAERLNYYTSTDLTADEIHAIGLAEVARIHEEMRAIMNSVGFEGSLQDFFTYLREAPQFYYPQTKEGRARYLREATALINTMRQRLPEVFSLFPKARLIVKRVEPFRQRAAGLAFYQYPPPDGSRPGIYYANLYDMRSMPTYQMEALAYHEGIPGHHMQRAITVELQGIPEFQKYTGFTAFSEGWGLYAELLPKEMGFYSDPFSDFGRLDMEVWRAARLVVDTGLHHKRWTREQAIDYLRQNTAHSAYECEKAIERYAVYPGQATAYTIGKLKIVELREKARAALGEQFNIRDFHDEVLRDGPLSLPLLEQKIDRWITAAGSG